MSLIRLTRLLILLLPTIAIAGPDEYEITDQFNSVSTNSPDAYTFAKTCLPSATESSFQKMIKDVGSNASAITRGPDPNKPFLVVNSIRTTCVSMSSKHYPILPLEIFDNTVGFNGMSADTQKALRTSLARQLAQHGAANAFVKNDSGNAYAVYYLFASDTPSKIYYHVNFLKAGEFDENKFEFSTSGSNTMEVTSRGQPPENVKYIFQK